MAEPLPRFTHYFDVRVAKSFESDIEDFDTALDAWIKDTFDGDSLALRRELLSTDESTKSMLQGIIYSDTSENA